MTAAGTTGKQNARASRARASHFICANAALLHDLDELDIEVEVAAGQLVVGVDANRSSNLGIGAKD